MKPTLPLIKEAKITRNISCTINLRLKAKLRNKKASGKPAHLTGILYYLSFRLFTYNSSPD